MTPEKGHEILIRAFNDFVKKEQTIGKDFSLLLAGDGPLKENLHKLCKELLIEDKVAFTGTFEDRDKAKIYSAMDVFVSPSYTEGFGIVLVEAMYFGLPVIVSDIEVFHEIGESFIRYFKRGSYINLAGEMSKIYEDICSNVDLKLDGEADKARNGYSMQGFIDNYLKLYKSLL
jgi:glycosyltransferase involved in cell wall biosynthesis